jgi:hypothetical protein
VQPGDPRANPGVVDLIELAGLWVAAEDWQALARTLRRLDQEFSTRFPNNDDLSDRFRDLLGLIEGGDTLSAEEIRRRYRRATVG